jgi:hypothetical protein
MGPPDGVLPGVVGMEMVLARNDRAVVFVGRLAVFPAGVEFELRVLTVGDGLLDPSLNGVYLGRGGRPREDNYDEMLRFGVEFSDGRRATNVGGRPGRDGEPEWRQGFWLWPLPPPGPLTFVCEWPAAGLALSRADIDAQTVIDAAARAQVVFPDQRSDGPVFGWSSSQVVIGPESKDEPPASSS